MQRIRTSVAATIVFVFVLLAGRAGIAADGATELTWYGHAAFKLKTPAGRVLLIDPWIDNPLNKEGKAQITALEKVDLILVSHGHSDHVGNSAEIARKTGAKLVTTFDLGRAMVVAGGFPKENVVFDTQGNAGGTVTLLDGEVTVTFVPAIHSSTASPDDATGNPFGTLVPAGNPGGFLIAVRNGPTIYHTGDTDAFGDMEMISKTHDVSVMLTCIGDHFTMGPDRAALAVKMIHPKTVIPMHFGTFPVLTGTPDAFASALKKAGASAKLDVMKVGETRVLAGSGKRASRE